MNAEVAEKTIQVLNVLCDLCDLCVIFATSAFFFPMLPIGRRSVRSKAAHPTRKRATSQSSHRVAGSSFCNCFLREWITLSSSEQTVVDWISGTAHSERHVIVVMAGGGGAMDFLRRRLSQPYKVGGVQVSVKVLEPVEIGYPNLQGASLGRLAVALGGTNPDYELLVHEHPSLKAVPGLVHSKQAVSNDLWRPSHAEKSEAFRPPQPQFLGEVLKGAPPADIGPCQFSTSQADPWLREVSELKRIADLGDAAAQFQVGQRLSQRVSDLDCARDAFGWYQRAARQGHSVAQVNLGAFYANGTGVAASTRDAYVMPAQMLSGGGLPRADAARGQPKCR